MDRKRPHDSQNDSELAAKRQKSTSEALIAQKRAEIAAKVAAMRFKATGTGIISAPPVLSAPIRTPTSAEELSQRVAEAKKRVAEAQGRLAVKDNPYMSTQGKNNRTVEVPQSGVGLKMTAHPLLLDTSVPAPQTKKDKYKPMQPKFASIKANARNAPPPPPMPLPVAVETKANPYASTSSKDAGSFEGAAPRERSTARSFRFNPKGKYVQIANQIRQDEKLEALKQRIAESARKAGLDSEFEGVERSIRRVAPPEAEWWDEALLPNKSYNDLDLASGYSHLNIHTPDSPITIYVQHPIPIPAPSDKSKTVEANPLKLTKQEAKKMRKQRRQAELQDKRDRQRMGLMAPDAPKVRLSNLMKVLTSDAVQDPTRVEAKVRREVAMRKIGHEKMNQERKLTAEQRHEKIENKKVDEEKHGIYAAVFKIKTLSDPAHRFKVRKNAEQMNLTGLCIFHPNFSLVYVEGAAKPIRQYKRLMTSRIAWTEAARSRGDDVDVERGPSPEAFGAPSTSSDVAAIEHGVASLENNTCHLIWEGQLRGRSFSGFRPRACPTDHAAKEFLGQGLAGYWDQAKNWKPEEEELY